MNDPTPTDWPRWTRGALSVSCDPADVNLERVAEVLADSYWAAGIPAETVARSVAGSLVFSLLDGTELVGFARVISDRATFAYLGDVFVLESHRGQGLGVWLIECVRAHPELQGLRRWMLATRDAHGLYRRFGFGSLADPDILMECHDPTLYTRKGP